VFSEVGGEDVVLKVVEGCDYGVVVEGRPGYRNVRVEGCVGVDGEECGKKCGEDGC
jgi:hypothetical protein